MLIKLSKTRGRLFDKIEYFKGKTSVKTSNAIVFTGANGSGKTVAINSIARAHGLDNRYMSSRMKHMYSSFDMEDSRPMEGASLYENGKKLAFDVVLRFRGEEARATPMSLDTMEDLGMVLSAKGSHGQVNSTKLAKLINEAKNELSKGSTILLLYDEPEAGLGIDMQILVSQRLREICVGVNERTANIWGSKIVVATHNPFVLKSCELGGATRIDFGGWQGMEDPIKEWAETVGGKSK